MHEGSRQSATPLQSLSSASKQFSSAAGLVLGLRSLQSSPPHAGGGKPSPSSSFATITHSPSSHVPLKHGSGESHSASIMHSPLVSVGSVSLSLSLVSNVVIVSVIESVIESLVSNVVNVALGSTSLVSNVSLGSIVSVIVTDDVPSVS